MRTEQMETISSPDLLGPQISEPEHPVSSVPPSSLREELNPIFHDQH